MEVVPVASLGATALLPEELDQSGKTAGRPLGNPGGTSSFWPAEPEYNASSALCTHKAFNASPGTELKALQSGGSKGMFSPPPPLVDDEHSLDTLAKRACERESRADNGRELSSTVSTEKGGSTSVVDQVALVAEPSTWTIHTGDRSSDNERAIDMQRLVIEILTPKDRPAPRCKARNLVDEDGEVLDDSSVTDLPSEAPLPPSNGLHRTVPWGAAADRSLLGAAAPESTTMVVLDADDRVPDASRGASLEFEHSWALGPDEPLVSSTPNLSGKLSL